jgi:DNA repair exonuclease SbcCD ATPase subunit
MTGENIPPTRETHDIDSRRWISRLDSNALIQSLERLRECFEQRLSQLEAVARERAPLPIPVTSQLERELQRRIAEYEEAQRRLRSQADRQEQEYRAALEQVEGDRKLLAEAWEQLERERLEAMCAAPIQGRSSASDRSQSPSTRPRTEMAEPANDEISHAILQQFHALRNDVRRNARRRGPL